MKKAADVRKTFLSFFEKRGHTVVPSASLIAAGDPTLLFTNAGMVPFKDVFLGVEKRPYTRATSCQKCLRVSGKHNDLEEIGPSPRHHTFFEMLGNFSFGDYFKQEALPFWWELLTKDFGLPPDRLHPTVYEEDDESAEIWSKLTGRPASNIVRLGADDNFWSMGDTGPCGPCSELMYDTTGKCRKDGSDCPLTCDCDRWWEVGNNVFMQYDRAADGTLTPLKQVGVDTGMGMERMTALLNGMESDYEADVFANIVERVQSLTGDSEITLERRPAYRAVADHSRAISFLIADGLLPSNEGRGYVLRRILRRASYQGRLLGLHEPFLREVCRVVIDTMGEHYSELRENATRILDLVTDEETRFLETLETGLVRLEAAIESFGKTKQLPGEEAFRLYDTYGFPIDLTRKVLEARGWSVDEEAFDRALDEQRERGRGALEEQRSADEALLAAARDLPATSFAGYDSMSGEAKVLFVHTTDDGIEIVLDQSPFYAEGGGQVGDKGRIASATGEVEIENVRRIGHGVFVHRGRVARGTIAEGETVRAEVEESTRRATMRNHTATHLLHRALRMVLGPQAKQAGSLVAPDRLRFDFQHSKPLSDDELREAERIVREQILLDRPVQTNVMPLKDALALGADAMFDEKYGNEARVVSVGDTDIFSRELCGGTHCRATGEIGAFFIVDQRSVGAGVRRVDAVTGEGAFEWIDQRRHVVEQLAREYNVTPAELPERVRALQERAKEQPSAAAAALPDPQDVLSKAERRNGTYYVMEWLEGADATTLREFGDVLRQRAKSAAVILGSAIDDKLNVVIMVTDDLVKKGWHAGKMAQQFGKDFGGGGGGRPDVATAGGQPSSKEAVLSKFAELVAAR